MPKKTKRQKLHADKVRKPTLDTPLSQFTPETQQPITASPSLFSFTRSSVSQSRTAHVAHVDHAELNAIRKDLTKTILLAAVILTAELLLAFYLR